MADEPTARPGGDALRRVRNADLASNTWLLAEPGRTGPGSNCVVIDPGLDHEALDRELHGCGWRPQAVLCTHGHFDHVGGAARLQADFGLAVHLDAADLKLARMSNFMMAACRIATRITLPNFTPVTGEAAELAVAGRIFRWHATPGHTPGSRVIEVDGLLFTGDTLYARGTALSQLPGADQAQLRQSLRRLFAWADGDLQVLPGHGGSARLAQVQADNVPLRAFLHDEAGACPTP